MKKNLYFAKRKLLLLFIVFPLYYIFDRKGGLQKRLEKQLRVQLRDIINLTIKVLRMRQSKIESAAYS